MKVKLLSTIEPKVFNSVKDAEEVGIVCIHQELCWFRVDGGRDIFLGHQPNHRGVMISQIISETQDLLVRVGINKEDPDILATRHRGDLSVGKNNWLKLLRPSKDCRILILDELHLH